MNNPAFLNHLPGTFPIDFLEGTQWLDPSPIKEKKTGLVGFRRQQTWRVASNATQGARSWDSTVTAEKGFHQTAHWNICDIYSTTILVGVYHIYRGFIKKPIDMYINWKMVEMNPHLNQPAWKKVLQGSWTMARPRLQPADWCKQHQCVWAVRRGAWIRNWMGNSRMQWIRAS